MNNTLRKILCLFGVHNIRSKRVATKEFYGVYSPPEGTVVIKNIYFCSYCGKDLTQSIEMQIYYQQKQMEYSQWCLSQSQKMK